MIWPILAKKGEDFPVLRPPFRVGAEKKRNFLSVDFSVLVAKIGKMRKNILAVWKLFVSLHPLSTEEPRQRGIRKEAEYIENLRSRDSVCRRPHRGAAETQMSQNVQNNTSNSYNEEFDPGSDER